MPSHTSLVLGTALTTIIVLIASSLSLITYATAALFQSLPIQPGGGHSSRNNRRERGEFNIPYFLSARSTVIKEETREHFQNYSILLTGATGGLGKSIALKFAKNCNVRQLILSGRDEEKLNIVATECQSMNNQVDIVKILCNLGDLEDVKKMGEVLKTKHSVDVFVHAGGLSSRSRFVDTDITVDELLMNVNFFAGAIISKAVVPQMIEKKFGNIIWISSIQGLVGLPYRTSYAASKFAVQGYCEGLRAELASSGVTVHVVSPGYIRTNLSMSAITGDGSTYNKMDDNTAKGADADDTAVQILNGVANGENDFIVAATASAKAALLAKFFIPRVLESFLVKRYEKNAPSPKN